MTATSREPSGALRERLTLQTDQPRAIDVSGLSWARGLVSATTRTAHGYVSGDFATIAGATPSGYTGKVQLTVTSPTTFTYAAIGPLTTPATGPMLTAIYAADAHGGRAGWAWRTLTTVWAELVPLSTFERLQRQVVEEGLACRFRVRARPDLVAGLRAIWRPRWPRGSAARTFLVTGVEPVADPVDVFLQCTQVTL